MLMPPVTYDEFAADVVNSGAARTRDENLAIVRYLTVLFTAKSCVFKVDPFIEKCGFKPGDVYEVS